MARNSLNGIAKLIKSVTEELPVEESLLFDLKKSIEMTDKKSQRKPSQTYKPSSMNCIRQSYYQVKGIEPEESSSSYSLVGMSESGTDRHIRIQKYLLGMKKNGFDLEYLDVAKFIKQRDLKELQIKDTSGIETKVYWPEMNLSFLTDGIIKYKNKYYILEIKTETSRKWFNRTGVDESHYRQATCYSMAFNLDDVIFIYENRDTCDKKVYLLHITDEMRLGMVGYIANCDSYIQANTVPPIPEDINKKTCEYCIYRNRCKKDGKDEVVLC